MLIQNGKILTMEDSVIENGYVHIQNGIIQAVGEMSCAPQDKETLDAEGGWVLPGLVDAHTHLGLYEDSLGFEGDDGNEDTDPITPQLRVIDGINPMERNFAEALAAGVTSVVVSPGSANPIGGQLAAIKTYGRRIDDMLLKAPLAIKFALGENPKSVYHDKNQPPVTRMATAALIRDTLQKAVEYQKKQEAAEEIEDAPDFDSKYESLLPLLRGEIPAHFHAHRADDIFTAIRIAREFSLRYVIIHGTEAHLVSDILADEHAEIITGPLLTDRSKPELSNMTAEAPALLSKAGVLISISTDHPETPLKYLLNCALSAVQEGLEEMEALKAITINSAVIAHIDDRVGSLKKGKDGDLVIFTGNPFDFRSKISAVVINGRQVMNGGKNA